MISFLRNRKKLCTALYILGFIISGLLTMQLLKSNSVENFSKTIAIGMTIVFEFSKAIMFIESQKKEKYTEGTRNILFLLWISTTIVSIVASQGFFINETNKSANTSKINSPEYAQLKEKETRLKEQISIKKDLLSKAISDKAFNISEAQKQMTQNSKLVAEYNGTIKSYQSKIQTKNEELQNAIFKKWVNTPEKLRTEIKQLTDAMNKTIAARDKLNVIDKSGTDSQNIQKLNNEIDTINNELNSINYDSIKTANSDGFIVLYQMIADLLGWQLISVMFLANLLLSVLLEVVICYLYHIATFYDISASSRANQKQIGFNVEPERIQTKPINIPAVALTTPNIRDQYFDDNQQKPSKQNDQYCIPSTFYPNENIDEPLKTKNKIGFEIPKVRSNSPAPEKTIEINFEIPEALLKKDVTDYLNYMYANATGNVSPGVNAIAKGITALRPPEEPMKSETARKIKALLEHHNIVKSEQGLTFILKTV